MLRFNRHMHKAESLVKKSAVQMYRLTQLTNRNQKFIILLGHMRSGSSVLFRVLSSSNQIAGLGERNAVYNTYSDFWKLAFSTRVQHRLLRNPKFYIDQVNHNKFTPAATLLQNKNIKLIFIYRPPHEAISSIYKLSQKHYKGRWSVEKSSAYYVERISFLRNLYNQLDVQKTLVNYQELIQTTDATLLGLSNFLNLDVPLANAYDIDESRILSGDRSIHIQQGKIVNTKSGLIKVPNELLLTAQSAYEQLHHLNSF